LREWSEKFWDRELPWQTPDPLNLPKPYQQPTCITVPGSTCTPPDPDHDSSDWFEKMKELIEEQNRRNEPDPEPDLGDSCSIGDRPDYSPPEASSENNDGDSQSEGGSENNSDPWADVSPEDFDEFVNTEPDYDPRPTTPGGRILSEHADLDSLDRHGFSEPYSDVDAIIDNPTRVTQQGDGANVYIQAQQDGSYNMAVVNPKDNSIVTAMKNLSRQELRNLGKNYGFDTTP
jgi:hypothetical protein